MSGLTEIIGQIGGALGVAGSSIAGYLATQLRSVRMYALRAARAAEKSEAALESIDKLRRGIELEAATLREERRIRDERRVMPPVEVSFVDFNRRLDELVHRLDECKADIVRERDARHRLQAALGQDSREDERQWREFHRILGEIQGELRGLRGDR